jgi:hypothetical protein
MPGWFADYTQAELGDHFFAQNAKHLRISDQFGGTSFGIDQPLSTSTHIDLFDSSIDLWIE